MVALRTTYGGSTFYIEDGTSCICTGSREESVAGHLQLSVVGDFRRNSRLFGKVILAEF